MGFQRTLYEKRALEIASYIDNEQGTIPSAIILSAQESADVERTAPRLRLFKSKINMRVPVIIYVGLSRKEELRLFIDINSKQKGSIRVVT
ncbi:hypothetical protein [Vibrio parahaemolyticus]|uniref:hypothetical protein n=1 Tax=Vibrio parahaemolyticus TaxID=670 RepID=UPI0023601443|nr:hypothetical protein [Vibrio parahaemolyticus]